MQNYENFLREQSNVLRNMKVRPDKWVGFVGASYITRMIWIRESNCLRGGSKCGCVQRAFYAPH